MGEKIFYAKESQKYQCSLSLSDIETRSLKFHKCSEIDIDPETYMHLILYGPSKQSNLGREISPKITKNINRLVSEIISRLDIKNVYFFDSYRSRKDKKDLQHIVKNDRRPFIYLYVSDSFVVSLYASIRNSLAHGNILKRGEYYYLYALSSRESHTLSENERTLSFLLKIKNFRNLSVFMEAFEKYR